MRTACRSACTTCTVLAAYLSAITLQALSPALAQGPPRPPSSVVTPGAGGPGSSASQSSSAIAPSPAPGVFSGAAVGAAGAQNSGLAAGLLKPPFPLGAATAAYQVEGAAATDGRAPSIWDTYAKIPGKVANNDTGDIADDFYHRYSQDLATAQELGLKLLRISISWSRILPNGSGEVNQKGLNFYSKLIDAVIEAGIEPHVTLYHWDMPQALEDEYGGWLGEQSITDFENYAEVVFANLGDRVKHWTTFNEIQTFVQLGYNVGAFAPGRCSNRTICSAGDSSTEPWLVLRHVLLAHGRANAQLMKLFPDAWISCNFNVNWPEPYSDTPEDQDAAERYMDFHLGIYANPLFFGQYPESVMESGVPYVNFTQEEQLLLNGSVNYFALNHYTSNYVTTWDGFVNETDIPVDISLNKDPRADNTVAYAARNGVAIGPRAQSAWLYVYPPGLRKMLQYVDAVYNHPVIYITECGVDVPGENDMTLQNSLNDVFRVNYFQGYIQNAIDAVQLDGVNVKGFFAWSLLDNFEWLDGYGYRFGIIHVDFAGGLARYAKQSARFLASWFSGVPLMTAKTTKSTKGNSSVAVSSIG